MGLKYIRAIVILSVNAPEDICENCRMIGERELLSLAEKEIERKMAEETIRQDNEFHEKERSKYLKTKQDRKEADTVNLAMKNKTKEPVEGLGFILEGRAEPVPDHEKRRQYKEDILQQVERICNLFIP